MSDNINQLIAQGGVQQNQNPLAMAGNVLDFARGAQSLKTQQFNMQQAQLAPAYQAMRQLALTKPDASWDDVNSALAQSQRIGGNVGGLVANAAEIAAKGGSPSDFVRATALGGMSPSEQMQQVLPGSISVDTGAGTRLFSTAPALSATPYAMTETGYVQHGLTPAQAMNPETIQTPQGPVVVRTGAMAPGGGGGSPTGGGANQSGSVVGGAPNNALNIRYIGQPGATNAGGFAAFPTPEAGQAATDALFSNYAAGGINTLSGLISKWAPPSENNTAAYIARVAGATGIDPNTPIDLTNPAIARKIQQAMAVVEGNKNASVVPLGTPGGGGGGGGGGGSGLPAGSYQVASNAPTGAPGGGGLPAGGAQAPYFRSFGATPGAPAGGGGGGLPSVSTGPGGYPVIQQLSPYAAKQYEQAANDFASDQQLDRALPQRTAPLQQALSILSSNKNLQTGPVQDELNHWQTAARALGMDVGASQNITDYQTLAKTLAQNMRGLPGANNSDLARLEAQAASPNMMQAREAIQELAAKQIGLERMRSAQYRQFVAQNGGVGSASNNSQFYNQQTADWMSKQDPLAYSVDQLPAKARLDYVNSLKGPARERFFQSYQNAKQLYGVDVTNAPE